MAYNGNFSLSSSLPEPVRIHRYTATFDGTDYGFPMKKHLIRGRDKTRSRHETRNDRYTYDHRLFRPDTPPSPLFRTNLPLQFDGDRLRHKAAPVQQLERPNFQQPQAITTQPLSNRKYHKKTDERMWNSGLFDCVEDMNICMCIWCCPVCYTAYILKEDFGEHWISALPCCLGPIGTFLVLRHKMRALEGIEGNLLEDCLLATCCFPCMAAQVIREKRNVDNAHYRVNNDAGAIMQKRATQAYNEMNRWHRTHLDDGIGGFPMGLFSGGYRNLEKGGTA